MKSKIKNRTIGLLIIALFALSLTTGCGKVAGQPDQSLGTSTEPDPSVTIGDLSVEIRDAYTGQAIANAQVKLDQTTRITGGDGVATFSDRTNGSCQLTADKDGYQTYTGRVDIIADKHIYLQVDLLPLGLSSTSCPDLAFVEISPYALSERSAYIQYRTSAEILESLVFYGQDAAHLDRVTANQQSGVDHSITLMFLEPGATYFYQIRGRNAAGQMISSGVESFCLPQSNLALGKTVAGTFDQLPPNDDYVNQEKDVLSRVVDGVTGYFEGMATSGSIDAEDQDVVIDLGDVYPVSSIVSYWRSLAYPEGFCVRLSTDQTNWIEVCSGVNAAEGVFARSDAGDPMQVVNTVLSGIEARYLQILIRKNSPYYVKHSYWDFVQLMEVEVFSEAGQGS